jgi:hypothetical protein
MCLSRKHGDAALLYLYQMIMSYWWDFLLETLHSIVNKFNFEWPMLLAKHVEKVIFLV